MCTGNVFKAHLLYRKSIAIHKDEMLSCSLYILQSNHPEPTASAGMQMGLPAYCRNQQYIGGNVCIPLAITM